MASLPGAFRLLSTSSQRELSGQKACRGEPGLGSSPQRDHVLGSMYQSSCDEFTPISHKSWWRKLINLLGVVQGKGLGLMPTPLMRTLLPLQRICCAGATLKSASSGSSGTEGQLWEHRDCHQNSREALSPHGLCKSGRPYCVTAWEGKE